MNRAGKWTLALGLASGALLAMTLSARSGKRTRAEDKGVATKPEVKTHVLPNDDSEVYYV